MATKKNFSRNQLPHEGNGVSKSGPIFLRVSKWRPGWLFLPERQIAAQNEVTVLRKSFAQRDQERSVAISSSAVSQNHGVAVCGVGRVQKAADGWVERVIQK